MTDEQRGAGTGGDRDVPRIVATPPGPRTADILARQHAVLYRGLAEEVGPFVICRKSGYEIEDLDGNVYLDCISAMASVPVGAARADITEAAVEALRRYGNEDTHYYSHEYVLPLAERLVAIAPGSLSRVDIALNGTEAVETAVRFMRRATGRPIVIGFMGGYHGEAGTAGAIGAETSDLSFGYRALMPGFVHVPYPNAYRTPFTARAGGTGDGTVDYVRDHLLHHAVDPREVAGFVIEPVMGSGGCVAPPEAFWPALADLCREFDFLLCADEVKTGFGRAGTMFAVERFGVEPDLMALGKSMGGGVMPIGALLGTEAAMDFDDVSTGSTWSWLPAACAAALATLDVFEAEPVLENVMALEAAGHAGLVALMERYKAIGDVRAVGCFMAIEFVHDRETKERDLELQGRVRIEIRVVPGGPSAATIEDRLRTLVAAHDATVELVEESVEPFETDPESPLVAALVSAGAADAGPPPALIGVPAWTDAHNFVELAASQAVVWGPGDFGLAHDEGEEIAVGEVVAAARTVEALLVGVESWLS